MSVALNRYLLYSLIDATIAIGAFVIGANGLLFNTYIWIWICFRIGLYASAVWVAMVVVAFIRFRSAAVRLLMGAPLALWFPTLLLVAWIETYRQSGIWPP